MHRCCSLGTLLVAAGWPFGMLSRSQVEGSNGASWTAVAGRSRRCCWCRPRTDGVADCTRSGPGSDCDMMQGVRSLASIRGSGRGSASAPAAASIYRRRVGLLQGRSGRQACQTASSHRRRRDPA